MPRQRLPNYLATQRNRWALSQPELGELLGVSKWSISKCERGARPPTLDLVLRSGLIFGVSPAELFPSLYKAMQDDLGARALAFDKQLRGRTGKASLKKLELLAAIPGRTTAISDL